MKHNLLLLVLIFFVATLMCHPGALMAAPDRDFQAFGGSIQSNKVNVRAGPGTNYPILWVYKLRGYPVKAIRHFGGWYKIVDVEGEVGWVYQNFVSPKKTAMVSSGKPAKFFRTRESENPILLLEEGVVVLLRRCALGMCEVEMSSQAGWVDKARIRQP